MHAKAKETAVWSSEDKDRIKADKSWWSLFTFHSKVFDCGEWHGTNKAK